MVVKEEEEEKEREGRKRRGRRKRGEGVVKTGNQIHLLVYTYVQCLANIFIIDMLTIIILLQITLLR